MSNLPMSIGRVGVSIAEPTDVLGSAKSYADADTAPGTKRAYASDWRDFEAWCHREGTHPLPAEPAAVAGYLASLADRGLSASTIDRRAAAIAWVHRRKGFTPPTAHEDVQRVQRGIRRTIGRAQGGKSPITADVLRRLLKALPDTLAGKRDRALLLFGFAIAARRSELVALRLEDLRREPEGVLVTIRRSKTDQEGRGHEVAVPCGKRLRPVDALDVWLSAAGIVAGPIFRSIGKGGAIGLEALTPQSVALIVKRWAVAAKLDAAVFAGHSLRSGLITQALLDEIDVLQIMQVSRHSDPKTLKKYDRRVKAFRHHAGRKSL